MEYAELQYAIAEISVRRNFSMLLQLICLADGSYADPAGYGYFTLRNST